MTRPATLAETAQDYFNRQDAKRRALAANLDEHTARKGFEAARTAYDRRHAAPAGPPPTGARARAGNPHSGAGHKVERAIVDLAELETRRAELVKAGVHPTDHTADGKELRQALAALGGA